MDSCQVQGRSDLYGLGLRVAFYIQWFGAIIVEYLEVADLPDIRLIGLLFSAAAFFGLIVKVTVTTLQPADVYIVFLLAMGIWFWCSCVKLGNKAFVAFNAILCFAILLVCVVVLLLKMGWKIPFWRQRRKKRRIRAVHVMLVKEIKTLSNIAVAATLTAAVELTISWNHIQDVNNISDVVQMLPLFISAGFLVRILFLHFAGANESSDSSEEDSDGESSSDMTESQGGLPPPPPVHPR
ncbi:hypothetical protein K4K55_007640 [Colletotrichum sp. SAR 10_96]|nr:hypothetical protein K4K55_007640 [Colletotrichum sp. SAR 10_96]